MNDFNNITVVIPSLDPDEKLAAVVSELLLRGFCDIILVNDGSRPENRFRFDELAVLPQCTVLTHEQNRGKGAALKTAFRFVIENRPGCIGVITADGDNQHHPDDIVQVAKALVNNSEKAVILGARNFFTEDIPFRSKIGNRLSSLIFSLLCRRHITDTQTGLRAIPFEYLPDLLSLEGDRFEYESNMLLALAPLNIPLSEIKIRTIYIEENKTSHFKPFVDSIRIIKTLFSFSLSSLLSAALDLTIFKLLINILASLPLGERTFIATFIARAISSFVNFSFNRTAVFKSGSNVLSAVPRYYLLCTVQLLSSWASVWGLSAAFGADELSAKITVDIMLFFISFFVQRNWVFIKNKSTERTNPQ